jgi:hypothetical protein
MRYTVSAFACAAVLAVLPGCTLGQVRETIHRTVRATGSTSVHIANSVGGVTVRGWDKPTIDVVAVKSAHSMHELNDIGIEIRSHGQDDVTVSTVYHANSGGGVDYTIMVPSAAPIDVVNETGGVRFSGLSGNFAVRTSAGGVQGDLGRVAGSRVIDIRVTVGGIDVTMARDSSATLDLHTTVGGVSNSFPGDRIGSGSAQVHLQATTGGISLHAS